MRNIINIKGRMNRVDYLGYSLLLGLMSFIIGILICYTDTLLSVSIISLISVFVIIFAINITIKRLHDIGRPWFHCFLLLVPLYNIYLSLILLFKKGTK